MTAVNELLTEVLHTLDGTPAHTRAAPAVSARAPVSPDVSACTQVPPASASSKRPGVAQAAPLTPVLPAAAGPKPVQQRSPESTTLLSIAGMSTLQRPGRRWLFTLGSILFAGAAGAVVVALAVGSRNSAGNVVSYNDIAALRQAQDLRHAAAPSTDPSQDMRPAPIGVEPIKELAAAPPPAPPQPATEDPSAPSTNERAASTPPSAALPAPANRLDSECRAYQAARRWTALEQCADRMKPIDAARAAELTTRAAEEARSAPHITAVTAALHDRNLKQARAELDQIWTGSVHYASLKRTYDLAEAQEIDAFATQLDSVKDTTCGAYNQLLAKERALNPPRVLAQATHRVRCVPQPKCDADALVSQGGRQFSAGQLAESLASYEAAYACRPTATLLQRQFVVACNLHNTAKARSLWKRLPEGLRTPALLGICSRNDITEAALNTR